MSRSEREQLCDLALRVGADAPTLSGEWTAKDLVVHLLVREGSPAAIGITVRPLAWVTEHASAGLARRDFEGLVARLRGGPPRLSPFAIGRIDAIANTLEFFVHHEDIRRAQPDWEPRALTPRDQARLWRMIRVGAKELLRSVPVGVVLERSDVDDPEGRAVVRGGDDPVVVRGLPSELVLFAFGRRPQARVDLEGSTAAIAALSGAALGI